MRVTFARGDLSLIHGTGKRWQILLRSRQCAWIIEFEPPPRRRHPSLPIGYLKILVKGAFCAIYRDSRATLSPMVATGYVFLGFLIGALTGLSSSPIAATVVAALFTFVGGSAGHLMERKPEDRRFVGLVVMCLAASCLVGLTTGIVVKINKPLTFTEIAKERLRAGTDEPYLKNFDLSAINAINVKYANHDISPDDAYRQLRREVDRALADTTKQ